MIQRLILLLSLLLLPLAAQAAGGVVAAADPRAAAAGREMLRAGGTAADAQMAMLAALTVVEPQSSGIGGGGFFVYHDAKTGRAATIDGRETAPASASPKLFLGADGRPMPFFDAFPGGRSVGIPGNVRLMARVHQRWGGLPWAKLFEPAIRLAENGFVVTPRLAAATGLVDRLAPDFPALAALYRQDGRPKPVGTTIRNPALAALFRKIATAGPDAFYSGEPAAHIIATLATSTRNPTVMTLADLRGYKAVDRDAVCGTYRTYKVCGMGPPSSGAVTVLQILGLLERFDMKRLGKNSPVAWHLIGEAMQLAYADRDKYLGDPGFVRIPLAGLLDRQYLAARSRLIAPATSLPRYQAGLPPGAEPRTAAISGEVSGTTNFVAVDGAGDVATMTSTVEGPFGSQLVSDGMVLNNELTDFTFAPEKDGAPVANRVEAGKRPLSSMAPTIVYDAKGRVILAIGSAGGKRIIMHVTRALIGVLDWDLSAADAIALPNIFFDGGALQVEQNSALAAMKDAIERLGQPVVVSDLTSKLTAVQRTPQGWRGAADPRSEGVALTE